MEGLLGSLWQRLVICGRELLIESGWFCFDAVKIDGEMAEEKVCV